MVVSGFPYVGEQNSGRLSVDREHIVLQLRLLVVREAVEGVAALEKAKEPLCFGVQANQ